MTKSILRKAVFIAVFLFAIVSVNAQTLYFCEEVDDDGYPIEESDLFYISRDGSYFTFLVRLPYDVRSDYVNFDIYYFDRGKEVFENTIKMEVESDWAWFWKEVTFYDDGVYKIYVYDDGDHLLCSGEVEVKFK